MGHRDDGLQDILEEKRGDTTSELVEFEDSFGVFVRSYDGGEPNVLYLFTFFPGWGGWNGAWTISEAIQIYVGSYDSSGQPYVGRNLR